jgi:hypothetical protein
LMPYIRIEKTCYKKNNRLAEYTNAKRGERTRDEEDRYLKLIKLL